MTSPFPAPDVAHSLIAATCRDPFPTLGAHQIGDRWAIRALVPGAEAVEAITEAGEALATLEGRDGLFAGWCGARHPGPYRLRARQGGAAWDWDDPYRYGPVLGAQDLHFIAEGSHLRLWEALGGFPCHHEGAEGLRFAVWAPNARRVSVVGDFNVWDGRRNPMRPRESGVWELFIPGLPEGSVYKYEICDAHGAIQMKADPFARAAELPPRTASIARALPARDWLDGDWMMSRAEVNATDAPISIYEVHLGSWRRTDENEKLSYRALADELVGYAREMGFTHLEFLPVSEFPFDGSWGYQPVGLFAPTSRFGDLEGFRDLVEAAHRAGLGVILDWVPGHFPSDPHGLAHFDGTPLYEHADPREGKHRDWDTLIYNYGRREVGNFLVANARYWMQAHHIDGLRVDAVASMLYRDYSREPGEWVPNIHGGRENLEAVEFLQRLNATVYADDPSVMTAAEESTSWPGVSHPVHAGGLGFGYKWNMGWMNDTLRYMSRDPIHRRHHHHDMTFGLIYAFSENFILPLSHDEVVHGKGSILSRMPGDDWEQFANLRAYYGFMWGHPGKKLLFMGQEFAQRREWNHDQSLDWHLLAAPAHDGVRKLVRDLNHAYRAIPALHARDAEGDGFAWLEAGAEEMSVYAWARFAPGAPPAIVICNFTPLERSGFRVGAPAAGFWEERINTDARDYGGGGCGNMGGVESESIEWNGQPNSISVTLPPLSTLIFTLRATD